MFENMPNSLSEGLNAYPSFPSGRRSRFSAGVRSGHERFNGLIHILFRNIAVGVDACVRSADDERDGRRAEHEYRYTRYEESIPRYPARKASEKALLFAPLRIGATTGIAGRAVDDLTCFFFVRSCCVRQLFHIASFH